MILDNLCAAASFKFSYLHNPLLLASICFLKFHFFGNGLLVDDIRPSSYKEEIMPPPSALRFQSLHSYSSK